MSLFTAPNDSSLKRMALLLALAFNAGAVQAQSQASTCRRVDVAPVVRIPMGKSTVMRPQSPVSRIILGNPDSGKKDDSGKSAASESKPGVAEVDVLLLGPSEIYLLGKTMGTTNVVMLDRNGACTAFDVVVTMDTTALQGVIQQLLPEEKEIKVSAAFDSIVLSGAVSDSEALTRVTDLANAYVRGQDSKSAANTRLINMLSVGAPQQVMLEVKVAEVSKSLLDQFGFDFSRAMVSGDGSAIKFLSGIIGGSSAALGQITGTGPNNVPYSSIGTVVGGSVKGIGGATAGNVVATLNYNANGNIVGSTYTTSYGTVPGKGVSNVNLNMQKTDGLVKVLAEPTVMAISGQTGSFLAGGKVFIPVSQSNSDGTRAVSLEEKEFGVSVKFTPTVLGNGRINLHVRPEVSELNSAGITITGLNGSAVLPSFTSRKAETTVQLMDGQSFAIGGLVKNNSMANIKAFPFLGELPLIGALFRSTEFQTDRTELVFVITPRLVKPLPANYRLPTDNYVEPSRKELIMDGRTEGKQPEPAATAGGFDTRTATEKK